MTAAWMREVKDACKVGLMLGMALGVPLVLICLLVAAVQSV